MKKIVYATGVLAALSLTLFTGCKKDSEAFPAKPQSNGVSTEFSYVTPYFLTLGDADGIFISAQVHDEKTVVVSPFLNTYEYGMAKFTNTTGIFSSLVSIGTIKLNDSTLVQGGDGSYLSSVSTQSLNLGIKATWQISGANTFNYSLNGVCPAYSYSFLSWDNKWIPIYPRTLYPVPPRPALTHINIHSSPSDSAFFAANKSTIATYLTDSTTHFNDSIYNLTPQYTIPINGYATDADSVIVTMSDATGFTYIRTIAADSTGADFSPNTFKDYPSYDISTFNLQVNAIKYRDTVVNAKTYYFLKMGSYIKYYGATK